jgi:hypothetical protein
MFLPLAVSLTALLLQRDLPRGRWRVMGPAVFPELLVEVGKLLIKLAPGLSELVKVRPALGIGGAVACCWLRVGGAT